MQFRTVILLTATLGALAGCQHKKKEDEKAVLLLEHTDTIKVTITYKGDDQKVLWQDGIMLQKGIKPIGKTDWATQPTIELYDSNYHKFNNRWLSINTR